MSNFETIIIGGGPTGVALGIELGLNGIKTLILEKHSAPLLSPRAQFLNARSIEFFSRWRIASQLKAKQLLPENFPLQQVWCSKLNGTTYAVSNPNIHLNDNLTPERVLQIPLWLTEETLRQRLENFPSVTFLKNQTVEDIQVDTHQVIVKVHDEFSQYKEYSASYLVGCDGANSFTRQKMGITFETLSPSRRVLHVMFKSHDLQNLIRVEKGVLFYILDSARAGGLGLVDLNNGLWHAQIRGDELSDDIEQVDVSAILNEMVGLQFEKTIIQSHFWDMHIQLATLFSKDQRVFLAGDSAHAFSPIGAFGLNTGLGDVVNLGWKLAAVISKRSSSDLLDTYEKERRPVCLNNLLLAQKNTDDLVTLRRKHDPKTDTKNFIEAIAKLAYQTNDSFNATMGYAYTDQQNKMIHFGPYEPKVAPGYYLPHCWIKENKSIYSVLSATNWTLIICGTHKNPIVQDFKNEFVNLDILFLHPSTYPLKYILIRPDWHVARMER